MFHIFILDIVYKMLIHLPLKSTDFYSYRQLSLLTDVFVSLILVHLGCVYFNFTLSFIANTRKEFLLQMCDTSSFSVESLRCLPSPSDMADFKLQTLFLLQWATTESLHSISTGLS